MKYFALGCWAGIYCYITSIPADIIDTFVFLEAFFIFFFKFQYWILFLSLFCLYFFWFLFCIYFSWIFARKWPHILQGPQLDVLCGFLSLSAWTIVISPVVVLIIWGCWLIVILGRDIIGLAVIMAGTALLLAFYSIMLWWRTQWQSSSMYILNILL